MLNEILTGKATLSSSEPGDPYRTTDRRLIACARCGFTFHTNAPLVTLCDPCEQAARAEMTREYLATEKARRAATPSARWVGGLAFLVGLVVFVVRLYVRTHT